MRVDFLLLFVLSRFHLIFFLLSASMSLAILDLYNTLVNSCKTATCRIEEELQHVTDSDANMYCIYI